ncbi:hypothetical protein EK904_003499 [Melospiza melodia maxima]|nr:hypothetical protein EK904_003499 [Melospiza melodia maxima]
MTLNEASARLENVGQQNRFHCNVPVCDTDPAGSDEQPSPTEISSLQLENKFLVHHQQVRSHLNGDGNDLVKMEVRKGNLLLLGRENEERKLVQTKGNDRG